MSVIVLNEGQAQYLNQLSRSCADYRNSWEAITKRGADEIQRMDNGQWVSGPSHQVMAEVHQEYGAIKIALNLIWSVFSLEAYAEEDRAAAKKEVDVFLKAAMGEPTGFHGTWFNEGMTAEKFSKITA